MTHSNNAARIRLWLSLKGLQEKVDTRMVTYADLQSEEFRRVNPLKKVPGFVTQDGATIFEASVIMAYLEDAYGDEGPPMLPDGAADKAFVNLLCRCHDLYIASPNCTQPNFSHTQGAMYLPPYATAFSAQERAMDRPTRAAKLAEIWKQLTWLEATIRDPFMAGDKVTHADMTWYPTCIFMEFMLPRVFGWPEVFHEKEHFPKLTAWFERLNRDPIFAGVRDEIWNFWVEKEEAGQFAPIRDEIKDPNFKWKYP